MASKLALKGIASNERILARLQERAGTRVNVAGGRAKSSDVGHFLLVGRFGDSESVLEL